MNLDIFSNQTLSELIDCLFWLIQIKMMILKDLNVEDIIYRKVQSKIIIINGKTFMINQSILI